MPEKTINIRHLPTAEALARAAAGELHGLLSQRNDLSQPFGLALSGGRIAGKFYDEIVFSCAPTPDLLENVHFFWADERCVPPVDAENNYFIAKKHLFDPLNVPTENVHRIRGEVDCQYAVREAEAELCRIMPLDAVGQPVLDVVILGMGEDGHVASLFPGEPETLVTSGAVYRQVRAVKPPPERITLGYAPIAAAREVWVLASGSGKREAFQKIFDPQANLPIKKVLARRGNDVLIFQDLMDEPTRS